MIMSAKDGEIMSLQEHLCKKWKNFFEFFDTDRDGAWTKGDLKAMADRLVREAGNMLSETGAIHVRKQSQHWLTIQEQELCKVGAGEITCELLCENLRRVTEENVKRKQLLKELDIYSEIFFDIIDINRDGKISKSELGVYFRAIGINNKNVIDVLFRNLDLVGDGIVTREEFRIAYREYFFGDQRERYRLIPLLFDKPGLLRKQMELFSQDE